MSPSERFFLQLMQIPGVGPAALKRVINVGRTLDKNPQELISLSPTEWSRYGVKKISQAAFHDAEAESAAIAELLIRHDIRMLVETGESYPSKLTSSLKKDSPPILFTQGNQKLLEMPGVAFGGSRNATELGLQLTRSMVTQLTRFRLNIISGYANGVDLTAHLAALQAGGTTTLVLAEGILRFRPKRDLAGLLDGSNSLIVSQFAPKLSWTAGNAMQRNSVVMGLADAMVIVEAGKEGGTIAAGKEALQRGIPLFVLDFADPPESAQGNSDLIALGAERLTVKDDSSVDLRPVLDRLQDGQVEKSKVRVNQQGLFDYLDESMSPKANPYV